MITRTLLAAFIFLAGFTGPSTAQETETLETLSPTVPGRSRGGPPRDVRGLRIAKPGALVLASFDADASLDITEEEIRNGSRKAFGRADTDHNGSVSIFEQQDWAKATGSHDGPLANALTFDSNLDRIVTETEFTEGLLRLSSAYLNPETQTLAVADLLETPRGASQSSARAERSNPGRNEPPRRSPRDIQGANSNE